MKYSSIILLSLLFSSGLLAQKIIPFRSGDQWGYVKKDGSQVVSPIYESADEISYGRGRVRKDGKYGFVDSNGKLILPCIYDSAGQFSKARIARVTKDGEKYYINGSGEKTGEKMACGGPVFGMVHFQTFKKDGKIGIIERQCHIHGEKKITILVPPTWDTLIENSTGYAAVRKDSLWAIIDTEGKLMTDYLYDNIEVKKGRLVNSFFKVEKDGKYGFLDHRGDVVYPPKYYKLTFYSGNHLAKAWINKDFWFYIDELGREFYQKN